MRVVTYARVSTVKQSQRGQSLTDQERAFTTAIQRYGWRRVRAYAESASAKTHEGRETFQQMIRDLPVTKPDLIVVHTLDRFTRNLREGLNELHGLRGHGVKLLPLDWSEPIDMDNDEDWRRVVAAFTYAEDENRNRGRRIRRSYEGRRERGATTHNRPPFGLRREGDRLVPAPTAWIVAEADRRVLGGEEIGDVARWAHDLDPAAWGTRSGLRIALENAAYVVAGVRTPETQRALSARLGEMAARYGMKTRRHDHEFAGVFRCGFCGERMGGHLMNGNDAIACSRGSKTGGADHYLFVSAKRIAWAWRRYVDALAVPDAALESLAAQAAPRRERAALERRLARIDQEEARLKERRDAALDLMRDPSESVVRQVRSALLDLDRDEAGLHVAREAVLGELAKTEDAGMDLDRLRAVLAAYGTLYARADVREKNALNRALCAAVGSHPTVYRLGKGGRGIGRWATYEVRWPQVDAASLSVSPR